MKTDVDQAVAAIGRRGASVDFAWLRRAFGVQKSPELYRSLDYGRAIADQIDQLNQYLHSYGPMIERQWRVVAPRLAEVVPKAPLRWIDYGCGQGLAGLLIREIAGASLLDQVRATLLIEPSRPAMARAVAIYEAVTPYSQIVTVNKRFGALEDADFPFKDAAETVHIFSNVLDIGGYRHADLLKTALSPGRHTIVAVSHDRDHNGGSDGFTTMKAAVEHRGAGPTITVLTSELERFACANRGEPAIMWYCRLDVAR